MDQKPVFLTRYALARFLMSFAERMGMDPHFADALAQVHVLQSRAPQHWSEWITHNCSECALQMDTCPYLNPTQEMCPAGTSVDSVRGGIAMQIERGRLRHCPAKVEVAVAAEEGK